MSPVPWSDEFFIKRLISKKKKKKKKVSYVYFLMNSFILFFMIHETTPFKGSRQHKGDTMQIKSKLYLRIIMLINYITEENLFIIAE